MSQVQTAMRVVLDQQASDFSSERKLGLLQYLLEGGHAVTLNGDDGAVAPLDDGDLVVLREASAEEDHTSPATEGELDVHFRGIAGLETDAVVALVDQQVGKSEEPTWKPWFPVIDYDRCTNCMQCLSFCLFGVYDVDEEKQIDVQNPQKCKTNCPACSRVCPEVAILFPKYKNGPINGDVVQAQDIEREKMKTDISSLLGGDIYAMLRDRHERATSRFSKERDEDRALKERKRCLTKLQKEFDIPPEVLAELPSAEEIQAKVAKVMGHDETPES